MINFDDLTKENIKEHNIRILITEVSGSIEYANDMDDIYENIEEYNPNKKHKILVAFDDMIADMLSNEKPNPIVTEIFR